MRPRLLFCCALASVVCLPVLAAAQTAPPPAQVSPRQARVAAARRHRESKDPGAILSFPVFEMLPQGGSRLSVQLSQRATVTEHASAGAVTYVFEHARVDVGNDENPLETMYFNTPVLRARLHHDKADAALSIALRADAKASYQVIDTPGGGALLQVDFPAGSFLNDGDRPMTAMPAPAAPTTATPGRTSSAKTNARRAARTPKSNSPRSGPAAP